MFPPKKIYGGWSKRKSLDYKEYTEGDKEHTTLSLQAYKYDKPVIQFVIERVYKMHDKDMYAIGGTGFELNLDELLEIRKAIDDITERMEREIDGYED